MPSSHEVRDGWVTLPWPVVLVNRLVWSALVAGQIAFAGVTAVVLANGGGGGARLGRVAPAAVAVDVVLLAVGVVAAVVCRRWPVPADHPAAACRGNLILPMAILEAASLFGLALWLVSGTAWPTVLVPAGAVLVELTLWPRRRVRARR